MEIIHKMIYHDEELVEKPNSSVLIKKKMYLCNQAVNPTPKKMSLRWSNVTCKNCLINKKKLG